MSFIRSKRFASTTRHGLVALALAGAFAAAGCSDDDHGPMEPPGNGNGNGELTVISDDIENDTTWTEGSFVVIEGPIFVGSDCGTDGNAAGCDPVTLTIEPGVTVLGQRITEPGVRGTYMVVTRGSRIIADANADSGGQCTKPNPDDVIVFTSAEPRGQRARGDWGGLVINGQAPINTGVEAEGEGDSGLFGGPDVNDDSGILRGVRVEFAGDDVTEADQLNGIAFQGVGAGTTVCYVQVHYNVDDGTEPFGGAVTQTHMVMTGIGDDSFDATDGYRGFAQFGVVQQRSDNADQGFELSNNGDTPDASPESNAVYANITAIGAGVELGSGEIWGINDGASSDIGILLREGSHMRVVNSIVTGFGDSGFDVEGSQAAANADARLAGSTDPSTTLSVEGTILWMNGPGGAADFADASGDGYVAAENQTFFTTAGFSNLLADPNLPDAAFDIGSRSSPPDVIPSAMPTGYTAATIRTDGLVMPTDGRTLQQTGYAGAVEPGTSVSAAWYSGWTVWATDGSDSRPGRAEAESQ